MLSISFCSPNFRIRPTANGNEIFDAIRKKWLMLTPEEWVRQQLIASLVANYQYPSALIGIERRVKIGERLRRFDAVIFTAQGNPWMLIECKSEFEALNDGVLSQILAYQTQLQAKYLLLTNGKEHFGWLIEGGQSIILDKLPTFETK